MHVSNIQNNNHWGLENKWECVMKYNYIQYRFPNLSVYGKHTVFINTKF